MSFSAQRRRNLGAYGNPFSGVGHEFYPLNVLPDHAGLVLHEAGYLPRNAWWMFPNVLSPFWRLYFNFDRGHRVIFPSQSYELGPSGMMLIPDRQLFHCHGRAPVRTFWLAFSVARPLDPAQSVPIVLRPDRTERALIERLCRLMARKDAKATRDRIFHLSLALLHIVLNREEIAWRDERVAPGLSCVRQYIEEHFMQPLPVAGLAAIANMSLRAFSGAFLRSTGTTPARFISQVRVREAAHLLANSEASLEEIAERTGFPNRDYLSRVFRKFTGEPPAYFRRTHSARPATP